MFEFSLNYNAKFNLICLGYSLGSAIYNALCFLELSCCARTCCTVARRQQCNCRIKLLDRIRGKETDSRLFGLLATCITDGPKLRPTSILAEEEETSIRA